MENTIIEFNDDNFVDEVEKSETPVLVDFWAVWCMPCVKITPIFHELAEMYGARVKFGKVNVDECPSTARKYGIRSIPTLLLFKNGQVFSQIIGLQPKRNIAKKLDEAF